MEAKIHAECLRLGERIPYIAENGTYSDMRDVKLTWWTNGFWPGILWQMYQCTGDSAYKTAAEHTEQEFDKILEHFEALHHDVGFLFLHTAVADYRPETVADKKIKREKEEELTLHLQATQDIAANLGALKGKNQLLVGFALETNNEQQNAEGKLERKNFDFIVLNSLNDAGAGFRHDTNKISIIDRKGRTDYPLKPKTEVAQDIIDRLVATLSSGF